MNPLRIHQRRRQHGLSLIETMVGLTVALLVGLAAVGSAAIFGASQRQGVATGSAHNGANNAVWAVRRVAGAAGLGFFGRTQVLCGKLNLSRGASVHWDGADFAPYRITRDANGNDRVDLLSGRSVEGGTSVQLAAQTSGADAALQTHLPAKVGDLVLLSPGGTSQPCLVRSVTAVTAATEDAPAKLSFAATGTANAAAFTTNPTYGLDLSSAGVTLLGQLNWERFRLSGTDLLVERPLDGTSAVLARNVVAFRVQYGVGTATNNFRTLEEWVDATGTYASVGDKIARIRGLRIGLVMRADQREKANASGTCEASSSKPKLFGAVEIDPGTDWACWRYRTAEAVVPLRNAVWGL